ncbi:MAG: hypothetical protein AB7L13_08185 [Acidimicrobiia bacterium]
MKRLIASLVASLGLLALTPGVAAAKPPVRPTPVAYAAGAFQATLWGSHGGPNDVSVAFEMHAAANGRPAGGYLIEYTKTQVGDQTLTSLTIGTFTDVVITAPDTACGVMSARSYRDGQLIGSTTTASWLLRDGASTGTADDMQLGQGCRPFSPSLRGGALTSGNLVVRA